MHFSESFCTDAKKRGIVAASGIVTIDALEDLMENTAEHYKESVIQDNGVSLLTFHDSRIMPGA